MEQQYKEILSKLSVGDKIYFKEEKRGFEIKARDERYLICTKLAFGEAIYTILDSKELVNSTNNYVFNPYDYKNQTHIDESLLDLQQGGYELSKRKQVNTIEAIDRYRLKNSKETKSFI